MSLGIGNAYRDEKCNGIHYKPCNFWFRWSCRIYIAMAWSCHRDCSASLFCILCHLMHNGYFWWQVRDTAIHSLGNQSNLRSIIPNRCWFNNTSLSFYPVIVYGWYVDKLFNEEDPTWLKMANNSCRRRVNKPFCRLLTRLVLLYVTRCSEVVKLGH